MKILILGANGMAGHLISLYFIEKGYDVTGFTRDPFPEIKSNIVGDALNLEVLKSVILEGNYDVIINCIGLLNQNAENNPSQAILLNSYLPHFIADIIKDKDTKLIHMSTDCVFSGRKGHYIETSVPDGETIYDKTKALGEVIDNKNLTFRNSIIGPDINEKGIGLFNWFMHQTGTIYGYLGANWTGVTTLTLAKAMEAAIEQKLTGLYHLVNNQSINKYDLLQLFNKYFRGNGLTIIPKETEQVDKSLINTRSDFTFVVPSYEEMVKEMKEWVENHTQFYKYF